MVSVAALQFVAGVQFPSPVMSKTLKMLFSASPLGRLYKKNSFEKKWASSFAVRFVKTLNKIPPSSCERQAISRPEYRLWWSSLTAYIQTEHELIRINDSIIVTSIFT